MTDSTVPQSPPPANEVYGIFAGPIDQGAVARIANAAVIAGNNSVTQVHLAFQTAGGNVSDGVALYNLFRALPLPITLYNFGTVASAGVTAYLGAQTRAVSSHGSFMIHKTTSPPFGATSERLQAMAKSVIIDDARMDAIFAAAKLNFTKEQTDIHRYADLWLSAEEAVAAGIATELKEFAPPKGTQLFFLGPT